MLAQSKMSNKSEELFIEIENNDHAVVLKAIRQEETPGHPSQAVDGILENTKKVVENIFSNHSIYINGIMQHFNALPDNYSRRKFLGKMNEFDNEFIALKTKVLSKIEFSDLDKFSYLMLNCPTQLLIDESGGISSHLQDLMLISSKQKEFHSPNNYLQINGAQNWSPFHIYLLVMYDPDAFTDPLNFTQKLVENEVDFNEKNNKWGNTVLHFQISNAQSLSAVNLIKNLSLIDGSNRGGLDVNVLASGFGTAPLHLAVAKGYREYSGDDQSVLNYVELVKVLIEAGANVNIKTLAHSISQRVDGERKENEGRRENSEGCSIVDGQTPLHIACARRDDEMIKVLIENGSDTTLKNAQGLIPEHVLYLPYEQRKKTVDSITEANNFVSYSSMHDTPEHMRKCEVALGICRISMKMR